MRRRILKILFDSRNITYILESKYTYWKFFEEISAFTIIHLYTTKSVIFFLFFFFYFTSEDETLLFYSLCCCRLCVYYFGKFPILPSNSCFLRPYTCFLWQNPVLPWFIHAVPHVVRGGGDYLTQGTLHIFWNQNILIGSF